ncbi:MAG: response regulator [Acidobacteria bacterium]|nr:response regulator [Acidobacteriota bacterium]
MKLPHHLRSRLRTGIVPPRSAPVLRYGVAVLSTILALIPALVLSDVVESRLVVFAVAVMVSAWYGGWKPGLVATAFALSANAYFALHGASFRPDFRRAVVHLALFVFVALLICSFNAALRSAQEGLRRSESNFRSLVTNSPYGIFRCDSQGMILDANPAFVEMLGYDSAAALVNRNLGDLHRNRSEWSILSVYFSALRDFTGLTAELIRRDEGTTAVRLSGRAIRDDHKQMTNYELFAEDVTERRTLEQQLRQAQKMEAVGRLAGGIAHDFNNLLMVISGYCEFLLEKIGADPALLGPAQEIANAAERATSLTRQLLAFSRKQMLTPKILDLNAVVTENAKMLTRMIGEDIDLVVVPGMELGAVKADPGQVEQVIMNLAVNARDAMPQGGKLQIETSNARLDDAFARSHPGVRPGEYVKLSISDTGEGMDGETQSHIFEPFFTTKGTKGTGLGLSTVYGIVKQSGGYIWVQSDLGKGATFEVYLPRVTESGESATAAPSILPSKPPQRSETILLVEDESNLRRLACQFLETQGYNILEAEDGAAAVQICAAQKGEIDLLLTDVIMPGMNGRELAKRIISLRPAIKVLYMSGYTENTISQNGTLDPGVNLLQKPFNLQLLKEKIREVLDSESLPPEVVVRSSSAEGITTRIPSFRAQRFKLQLPIRYRPVGDADWRRGTTENISRSGVLFRAEEALQPAAQLEISLVLPPEIAGLSAAEVVCRGEVVRTVEGSPPTLHPALAAKILQYHFQHGSGIPQA